jgi:hypothetical protein
MTRVRRPQAPRRRVASVYRGMIGWMAVCEGVVVARGATADEAESNAVTAGYRTKPLVRRSITPGRGAR